jgi:zinc and cadmium transporter
MLDIWIWSICSVIVVSLISFIGIFTLSLKGKSLVRVVIYLVSFSAGALIGDAFIHLLPEATAQGFGLGISFSVLLGIGAFFILEKIVRWRHCHMPATEDHPHTFAYMNLVGDAVHNLIDGLIIAASYLASIPVGIATTIAVLFHEIPQEMGDFGVLIHGGFKTRRALCINFLTALTAVLGVVVALLISGLFENIEAFLLAFAAGGFVYVALSDLVPELHSKNVCDRFSRDALYQLVFFILGIFIMYSLVFLE